MRKSLFSKRQWNWIAERFQEGYTIGSLADFLRVHRETVRRGLVRQGVKPRNRRSLPPLDANWDYFLALHGEESSHPTEEGPSVRPMASAKRALSHPAEEEPPADAGGTEKSGKKPLAGSAPPVVPEAAMGKVLPEAVMGKGA